MNHQEPTDAPPARKEIRMTDAQIRDAISWLRNKLEMEIHVLGLDEKVGRERAIGLQGLNGSLHTAWIVTFPNIQCMKIEVRYPFTDKQKPPLI